MNSLSLRTPWLCALIAAAAAWSPAIAAAQDCTGDTDCGDGYRCQTDSYESCGGAITCTPDGECTEAPGECMTETYSWCTNAICNVDADCPSSMACQAQTTWQCDGGGAGSGSSAAGAGGGSAMGGSGAPECPPGEMCNPPTETVCVEVPADSICIPRYQLPCTVASDCGGGFDCLQSSNWECSGSAGTGGMAGGAASGGMGAPQPAGGSSGSAGAFADADGGVAEPPSECHEVPSASYYCQLQDLPCSADAECPDGLKCLDQYIWTCTGGGGGRAGSGATTAGAGGASMGGAGTTAPGPMVQDEDAGVSDGSECTTQTQQRCMPPDYAGGPGDGSGSGGMTGGGSADAGVFEPPAAGSSGSGNPGSGGAGGAAGGPTSGGGVGHGESDDDHDHGHHFGWLKLGCSAGGPIGGDPLGWLALGMVTLVLRRRARRG